MLLFASVLTAIMLTASDPTLLHEDLAGCFENPRGQGNGQTCVLPAVPATCGQGASGTCTNTRTGDAFLGCWVGTPTPQDVCRWANFWCNAGCIVRFDED